MFCPKSMTYWPATGCSTDTAAYVASTVMGTLCHDSTAFDCTGAATAGDHAEPFVNADRRHGGTATGHVHTLTVRQEGSRDVLTQDVYTKPPCTAPVAGRGTPVTYHTCSSRAAPVVRRTSRRGRCRQQPQVPASLRTATRRQTASAQRAHAGENVATRQQATGSTGRRQPHARRQCETRKRCGGGPRNAPEPCR